MASSAFSGRTALITGAASGIGAACARWLAGQGIDRLVLVDVDREGLAALELPLPVENHCGSVADEALWAKIEAESGRIDYAVLNAGISTAAAIAELDFADWRRTMAVNLDGLVLSLRCAMRQITDGGAIVITASATGIKAQPATAAYGASKAAAIHLAKVAAKEGLVRGIRVNAIAPAGVATPIWDTMPFFQDLVAQHGSRDAAVAAMVADASPLARLADADQVASQIGFLLSDAASVMTGAVLVSDGGFSL